MTGIEIQKAGLQDIDTLMHWRMIVLHEVFTDEHADWHQLRVANERYYLEALAQGSHIAVLAKVKGQVVGCGGLCLYDEMPSPDNPSGRCAYLMNIYVVPELRRHAIGALIVSYLCDCARSAKIDKIYLESAASARNFYHDLGFADMPDMMKLK